MHITCDMASNRVSRSRNHNCDAEWLVDTLKMIMMVPSWIMDWYNIIGLAEIDITINRYWLESISYCDLL